MPGASIVAMVRDPQLVPNPRPATPFQPGDRVGLIGTEAGLTCAEKLVTLPDAGDSTPAHAPDLNCPE